MLAVSFMANVAENAGEQTEFDQAEGEVTCNQAQWTGQASGQSHTEKQYIAKKMGRQKGKPR